jgi:hypothetical protein
MMNRLSVSILYFRISEHFNGRVENLFIYNPSNFQCSISRQSPSLGPLRHRPFRSANGDTNRPESELLATFRPKDGILQASTTCEPKIRSSLHEHPRTEKRSFFSSKDSHLPKIPRGFSGGAQNDTKPDHVAFARRAFCSSYSSRVLAKKASKRGLL